MKTMQHKHDTAECRHFFPCGWLEILKMQSSSHTPIAYLINCLSLYLNSLMLMSRKLETSFSSLLVNRKNQRQAVPDCCLSDNSQYEGWTGMWRWNSVSKSATGLISHAEQLLHISTFLSVIEVNLKHLLKNKA